MITAMQVIVFETEKLRNALNAVRPFSHAEVDCHPSTENIDAVQIEVDGSSQKARLSYRGMYFQWSTSLLCRASQGDLNIYADIDDLLLYVDDIETEEFMIMAGGLETKHEGDVKLNIYDEDGKQLLGKVDAHYADKPFYFCDTYAKSRFFRLPSSPIANTLREFEPFTNEDVLHRDQAFVWFLFGTDDTAVIAYTSHALKRRIFDYNIGEIKTFGFLGYIGKAVANLMDKCSKVSAIDTTKFYSVMCDDYFVEMLAPKEPLRNYIDVLVNFKPTLQFEVAKKDLLDFVKQAIESKHWFTYTCLHSKGGYTRLHCIDAQGNESMRRFIVNEGYAEDTTLCISTFMLEACLNNIKSPMVRFQFNGDSNSLVSIAGSTEPYKSDCAQLVAQKLLKDDELEIMQCNDAVLDKEIADFDKSRNSDNGMEIIKVGEVFSRHAFPLDGKDHVVPVITDYGIDVVICLSNPSLKERRAFSNEPIELYLVETRTIPFILLKFGTHFTQQFALNVAGMHPKYQSLWLNDSDRNMLRLFLVNAYNAVLVAMRFSTVRLMSDIKALCKKQLSLSRETVNEYIAQTESYLSINEMIDMANKTEIIERPEIKL